MTLTWDERYLLRVAVTHEIAREQDELNAARERLPEQVGDKYRQMDADNIAWTENRIAELSAILAKLT